MEKDIREINGNGKNTLKIKKKNLNSLFMYFQREGKRGREGEKHQLIDCHTPPTGDPDCKTGMCSNRFQTAEPLVCRWALNLLSHTNKGEKRNFFKKQNVTNKIEPHSLISPLLRTPGCNLLNLVFIVPMQGILFSLGCFLLWFLQI